MIKVFCKTFMLSYNLPRVPNNTPIEPKLENPQRAKVRIDSVFSSTQFTFPVTESIRGMVPLSRALISSESF